MKKDTKEITMAKIPFKKEYSAQRYDYFEFTGFLIFP